MKTLMINSNRYLIPTPVIPFGICCVSSAIEKAGHEVRVLDLSFSKNCSREINETVKKFQPDIIGISIRNIDTAAPHNTLFFLDGIKKDVINPVKKVFPGPIVIGGPAVGISGSEMLSFFDLEFAIRGDGEKAMLEFIRRIENDIPLSGLLGLIWRKENEIIEENSPMYVNDLDELPHANQHRYINLKNYRKYKAPIQIQTKRGCQLHCSYCTYNTVEGHSVRLRDPQMVADEIENIVKETGVNHIEFTDSTFNVPLDHAKSILRAIIAKNLDLNLQTMGLNPSAIDEEFADLLQKAQFQEIQVGIESGSNVTLKSLGKNYTKTDIIKAAKILRGTGIPIMWWILTGAPGETEETLQETFDTILQVASKWDLVTVGNGIRVYKGAPISKILLKRIPDCTNDDFLHPVTYVPANMELKSLRKINKAISSNYPNVIFFDEFQRVPFQAIKFQTAMMKLFAPQKPWWKFNILFNRILKYSGLNFLIRILSGGFKTKENITLEPSLESSS